MPCQSRKKCTNRSAQVVSTHSQVALTGRTYSIGKRDIVAELTAITY